MGYPKQCTNPCQGDPKQDAYMNPQQGFPLVRRDKGRDGGASHGFGINFRSREFDVNGEQHGKRGECVQQSEPN